MTTLDRELIDRARAVDMVAVAQRHGAKLRKKHKDFAGPCPKCAGTDRFVITPSKRAFICRGCDAHGDAIDLLMFLTGRSFTEAVELLTGEAWPRREITEQAQRGHSDGSNNAGGAGRIWRASVPIAGTVAEIYLTRTRGIDLEQIPDLEDVLRFHRACPFGGGTADCLIALVRDVITDAPKAIVRTAISADGRKAPVRNTDGDLVDRMALGPKAGGAIKLWPDASVTTGLVIGEGLETTASAATRITHRGTLLQPAWALIDAGNLAGFPVLPGIEALTILVDNDPVDPRTGKRPGQYAADECTERWLAAGCHVEQLIPDVIGSDFNDVAHRGSAP
jgi:phage/plasmid primase-like uncharacterized protein